MNIWEVRSGKHIRSYRPEGPSGELYKVHTDLTLRQTFDQIPPYLHFILPQTIPPQTPYAHFLHNAIHAHVT